jgi:hypothetical protein
MNIISVKEYIGTLIVMCVIWVMIPWEPGLSRFDVFVAFMAVACIAFAAVALVEMTIDAIREWRRAWKNR